MAKSKLKLTAEEKQRINIFVDTFPAPFTRQQWGESYQQWHLGGRVWGRTGQGGTGQMKILMWYHHIHKPGSMEWRPSIILRALLSEFSIDQPSRQ